jgi:TatD DNase family protein
MLIDSHAHLGYDSLYDNIDTIMQRAFAEEVLAIINICTDEITAQRGLALQQKYPCIYNVGSTTPHDTEKLGEKDFAMFSNLARQKKLVAIGETGLDYFYDYSPKKTQQKWLTQYLELAVETNLPVVIHCRDAFSDLFAITENSYKERPLLLHCFTGTISEAKQALDRGWMISFSGIVTFKKSTQLQEAAAYVPMSHLVVETDSPYLAPQSKRGQTNEPSFLKETAKFVADLKKVDFANFCHTTRANTKKFFHI